MIVAERVAIVLTQAFLHSIQRCNAALLNYAAQAAEPRARSPNLGLAIGDTSFSASFGRSADSLALDI